MSLRTRLSERMDDQGLTQSALARRVSVTQQTIGKLVRGEALNSVHLHKIARELNTSVEYLTGEVDDPSLGASESRQAFQTQRDALSENGLVPVQHIDLAYGMGGTFIDGPVPASTRFFPLEFLRAYTKADPSNLVWASGAGDSMYPTISDSDALLIDTSLQSITMADRIWAIAVGDVGMIKRLRPLGDVLHICSDNPNVSDFTASDGEVHIIGRVVAKVGKI